MSEGHSIDIDASAIQAVPHSDALIDGFTVPQVPSTVVLSACSLRSFFHSGTALCDWETPPSPLMLHTAFIYQTAV